MLVVSCCTYRVWILPESHDISLTEPLHLSIQYYPMKATAVRQTGAVSGVSAVADHCQQGSAARIQSGPSTRSNHYEVLPALRAEFGRTTPYQKASLPTPPKVK